MKKGIYLTLVTLTLVMQGCIKDYIKHIHEHYDGCGHDKDEPVNPDPTVEISRTQLIVRFDDSLTDDPTKKAEIRNEFGIGDNFEPCSCGDPNLELWGNSTDILDVEGVVGALRGRSDAEGDFQFSFEVPEVGGFESLGIPLSQFPTGEFEVPLGGVIADGTDLGKVNIAVLDTGIDYGRKIGDGSPYLYGTSGSPGCFGQASGWNFVNGTGEILDDNGHGTYVTQLIATELNTRSIGYRILPVKIFNNEGQGSYWNVVCGMGYIQQLQKEGNDINIVNASFGGTIDAVFFEKEGLLNTIIGEMDKTLFVASAGNQGLDTDNGALKHFPSGYLADNLLAVGGYQDVGGVISIDSESNYGEISIDLAVPFEGWEIEFESQPDVDLMGTSYSAAYVSALVSEFYINTGALNPVDLKTDFLDDAEVSSGLDDTINGSKYYEK